MEYEQKIVWPESRDSELNTTQGKKDEGRARTRRREGRKGGREVDVELNSCFFSLLSSPFSLVCSKFLFNSALGSISSSLRRNYTYQQRDAPGRGPNLVARNPSLRCSSSSEAVFSPNHHLLEAQQMFSSTPKLISVVFPDAHEKVFTASDVLNGHITLRLETEGKDDKIRHKLKDVQISLIALQVTTYAGGPGEQGNLEPWNKSIGGLGAFWGKRWRRREGG